MPWPLALLIYRLLLPLLFLAAFPGWLVKMLRRGGLRTRLGERVAFYNGTAEETKGTIHVHAVSVGEAMLALKLIGAWREVRPGQRFVLATGTATGHAVATRAAVPGMRVTYAPLDFSSMVRRYLDRFEPRRIVLIEGEVWPMMMRQCQRRGIPVSLVNARMSPRSAARYRRFAATLRPLFSMLDLVATQEAEDAVIWRELGVAPERIQHTGSLKFDPACGMPPARRARFQKMLDALALGRPVVLAASTHAGEELFIVSAILDAVPHALPLIAPRHAERRHEVREDLRRAGFHVVMRSEFQSAGAGGAPPPVLVIDTTGELRDWTAHADVVIIGKSFLATGGQNPAEAITAGKPVIFGPHMENFQPLADRLVDAGGCLAAHDAHSLRVAVRRALDPAVAHEMTGRAAAVLGVHEGATRRILALLDSVPRQPN